jgi:hypothetical protein
MEIRWPNDANGIAKTRRFDHRNQKRSNSSSAFDHGQLKSRARRFQCDVQSQSCLVERAL